MKQKGSSFRYAALFVALAMVAVFVASVFLTPEGLRAVYPAAVLSAAENVSPDYSFEEYYDLKTSAAGCDMFFIGADTTVAESYTVILDLFRFLCRNFGVRTLALNVGKNTAQRINDCLRAENDADLQEKIKELRAAGLFTEDLISFVRSLAALNGTLPRADGVTVVSVVVDTPAKATVDKIHSELISGWGSVPEHVSEALSISDVDEFFEHFNKYPDEYREFLGDETFENYKRINEHRLAGDYKEWKIAAQLGDLVSVPALITVDRDVVGEKSPLRSYAGKLGAKAAFVGVKYVSSRGLVKGEEIELHDFSMPFAPTRGIYFVSEKSMSRFTGWYRHVCDPSGTRGDVQALSDTGDYFVIVGSSAVKYGEGTK